MGVCALRGYVADVNGRRIGLGPGVKIAGAIVCTATLLSAVRSGAWWVRVFDFPRVHTAALGVLTLASALGSRRKLTRSDRLFVGGVGLAVVAHLVRMLKYSPVGAREAVRKHVPVPGSTVSLMIANLRMRNRESGKVLHAINAADPDILIFIEPNAWWLRQLSGLESRYPWHVKVPRENTYGLAQYSRLEVLQSETRYLVQRDVPSIRSKVRLRNGRTFWLYAVHPRPPIHANLHGDLDIPGSGKRDAELVRVALELRNVREPSIVTGDFNDVAWSHTTRHFQRVGELLDPRVGRGFFNTYHARHWWLRFPVDHLFHTREFAVVDFERGPDIGSDHFPILANLALDRPAELAQQPPKGHGEDLREALEKVERAGEPEAVGRQN